MSLCNMAAYDNQTQSNYRFVLNSMKHQWKDADVKKQTYLWYHLSIYVCYTSC